MISPLAAPGADGAAGATNAVHDNWNVDPREDTATDAIGTWGAHHHV